jgi:type III pantothenate kinase
MLLAIDVGNTNTVLGLFDGDELMRSYRVKTDARSTADEYRLTFDGLLRDDPDITGVALCSTVPAVLRNAHMLERYFVHVPHVIIEPGANRRAVLMDNEEVGATASPTRCGHTCTAGLHRGDFGTSTNFDVVSAKASSSAFPRRGRVSLDALAQRAAQLRKVEFVAPRSVIAKNTVEALQSGALYGFAGQVDGIASRIIAELGGSVTAVIATGGLAPVVIRESSTVTVHRPDLTLQGLRLVYDKNV